MGMKEKVIKIVTEEGMNQDMKTFSKKVQKEILAGVGKRMLEEQKAQNERFEAALKNWEKLMGETVDAKIEAAINRKITG